MESTKTKDSKAIDKKDTIYEDLAKSVYVIAECGINHNGDFYRASDMISHAAECGADAVKFQVFEKDFDAGIFEGYVLPPDTYETLKDLAEDYTLDFIVSAFDEPSIEAMEKIGVKYWKIPSGETLNKKYLARMKCTGGEKYYISTGMASWNELNKIHLKWPIPNVVMQCTSEYPLEVHDGNLSVIGTEVWSEFFEGYSNHATPEMMEIPIAAVALGAQVLEIHFTLDRDLPGPDHFMSYEPEDLKELIERVDNISLALGDGVKRIMPGEEKLLHVRNRYK